MITAHMRLNSKRDAMLWAAQTADLDDDQQSRIADWIWKNKPSIGCVYAEHPLADISSSTFWMIADGPRTNPRRNPYPMQHVWEALTTKERSAILAHTGKDPLAIERFLRRMVARKPIRLRGAQPDFLGSDFGNYPNIRKNPFRVLRSKGGNTWLAQSQAAAALSLRAAGGRGASTSHRRYVLGQARDLRRLAYHTPKKRK